MVTFIEKLFLKNKAKKVLSLLSLVVIIIHVASIRNHMFPNAHIKMKKASIKELIEAFFSTRSAIASQ